MSTNPAPDTIVLIHGLYLTGLSWEGWSKRYTEKGYKVIAESWPGLGGDIEDLRRDPSITRLNCRQVLEHYEGIIRSLPQPPIIMGHSFGGAFTQVLVSHGLGAAAVVAESGTVRGIRDLPFSTLKANWRLLRNPFNRRKAVMLTPDEFRYGFTNTFNDGDSQAAYERYAVPGSRNVLFEAAFCNLNPGTALRVDFKKDDRAPLLFIAGGADHIIPPSVNRHNAAKYAKSSAVTAFKEYPGRSHFTMIQDGWEEVADYALDWAINPAETRMAA